MVIQEIINEAKQKGYTLVKDGANTWDIDNFEDEMHMYDGDYILDYNGACYRYNDNGYQESVPYFTFETEDDGE